MTHRVDVAHGGDIVARWCAFAEQRLEYLTELFETGRWRRFHSERAFLENIQEAKTAVETWRGLASRMASRAIPIYSPPTHGDQVFSDHAPSVPASYAPAPTDGSEIVIDIDAIAQRYPLLRNAL